ncbi:MAG: DNA-binding protein HU [Syntrophomonadaceae bacterium]|nr:DNA-binding protein HU [Bacillota bacterium]
MNKGELIKEVAAKTEATQKTVEEVISAAIEVIQIAVASGAKVTLVGFGTFEKSERNARTGRNPATGEAIDIPAKAVPKFTAGKNFREAVEA